MTTQTETHTSPSTERSFDEAADRLRDINERVVAAYKKAGNATLDSYERALLSTADLTEKAAGATQNEWISALAHTQAGVTRDLTEAYTAAARTLLK